jgi:hypothetical protein
MPPQAPILPQNPPARPSASPGMSGPEWNDVLKVQYIDKVLPNSTGTLLGGLQVRPKNVRFATQNKGEKIFILLRRHWLSNLNWMFNTAIYTAVPIAIYLILLTVFNQNLFTIMGVKLFTVVALFYYSVVITNALIHFANWYFNVYIVTDQRVIDYDFKSMVSQGVSELDLEDIQDVKEESVGILASFFSYGTISVFSASEKAIITFEDIPRPTFVRDKISDLSRLVKSLKNES